MSNFLRRNCPYQVLRFQAPSSQSLSREDTQLPLSPFGFSTFDHVGLV